MTENEYAKIILDKAFKIHKSLGPGLLESVYEQILSHELTKSNIPHKTQVTVPIVYDSINIFHGFRADIIVANKVIIELKSVETVMPVHFKQLLTYLKLTDLKLGLLINFNVTYLRDGIRRIVNGL